MTTEEMYKEMQEQMLEDALLGYRDHHMYDDAASTPIDVDYTTQSWTSLYKKSITFSPHLKQCLIMTLQGQEKWLH